MKTITLLILFFTISTISAQIVNIPDPVFKQRLIDEGVDTNFDGEIQISEAEAVTGSLYLYGQFEDIHDLTGIEAFVNITELNVASNQLTSLDLSQNTALIELYCYQNQLTYLNVENCINLEIIRSYQNQLVSLNFVTNINLNTIVIHHNQLVHLDIRNGNNINIISFSSSDNPELTCIFVDDAEYSENSPVWFKDPASTYVETEAECDAISVEDVFLQSIRAYPNPVKNRLYLQTPGNHSSIEISIVDVKGNDIINHLLQDTQTQIDISHLQSGIYFVILKDQQTKETLTKKLIKR